MTTDLEIKWRAAVKAMRGFTKKNNFHDHVYDFGHALAGDANAKEVCISKLLHLEIRGAADFGSAESRELSWLYKIGDALGFKETES